MIEEKKLALLIDSDNVSAKYAQFILQEASKYGELTYKRVYGDWEKGGNGWHFPAINNSIMPIQQTCYIAGKNSTDFSMIIDAMDILYSGKVDGFVLVTSDSDFTRLAIRLREGGMLVVGIGEVKTPLAFTSSCHHFSYLNQVCETVDDFDEKSLRKAVLDYVRDNDDKRLDLGKINSFITSRYGNIDYTTLGFNRLSNFIDSFSELVRKNTFVSLKKVPKPASVTTHIEPSLSAVVAEIEKFLKVNGAQSDNLIVLERHLNQVFGKIDFSRFGSKRFARVIDKLPEFVRVGTTVSLVENASASKVTTDAFESIVRKYAEDNMPGGGNLGQLNNILIEKFGKGYLKELGYDDFATALNSVSGVKAAKNFLYTSVGSERSEITETAQQPEEPMEIQVQDSEDSTEEKSEVQDAPEARVVPETPVVSEEKAPPEINAVKRDILSLAALHNNGIALPVLGKRLSEKYGKDYLKELGFRSMKSLVSKVAGVSVVENRLAIDEEFLRRTDEIEKFVYEFARGEGSRAIKALSGKLRKEFPGFDYTDYGYTKLSDFINAIDGVRASGYYVEPVD
ncbi:MAG: NYN domain-containing protein [Oscillospiraceae bacterium]|nr:NYN domain-containing protein [Oscillospiraceae bacterium]